MTKKGQKFVGTEIGRMMRKGPSSGPQKGKKMHQKQAVAVALNVARKKGYKVPQKEAVMYRDPEYGALVIVQEDDGLITYDHNSVDAPAVLAVLEQSMRPERRDDGGLRWHLDRAHPAIVEASVRRAVQALGYAEDRLAERAILTVPMAEAVSPDLPSGDKFFMVHEPLEAGLRHHVAVAVAALQEHGRVTPPTVRFHGRPNARDTFGRPLPFLIARAFIQAEEDIQSVEATLREALRPVEAYLVRATIMESDEIATIEIALAPTGSICEAYMDTSIPAFESHSILGARTVWLSLGAALGLEEAADIAELASMSTGAVGLRTERDGRAVVAHIPSSHPGTHVGDHAFQERLGWLVRLLDPWNPDVKDIGEQTAVAGGAPSHRAGLDEVNWPSALASDAPAADIFAKKVLRFIGAQPRGDDGYIRVTRRDVQRALGDKGDVYDAMKRLVSWGDLLQHGNTFTALHEKFGAGKTAKAIKGWLKSLLGKSYEDFVKRLKVSAHDPKVMAMIRSGKQDGSEWEDAGIIQDRVISVQDLRPTQNEIDISKSLKWPLTDETTARKCLAGRAVEIRGPIVTFKRKFVVDGHHRWSQIYACNANATVKAEDLVMALRNPIDALKAVQMAIASSIGDVPSQVVKGTNLLKASEREVKEYVRDTLKEALIPIYESHGAGSTREEIADYIWGNVKVMQKRARPAPGAPKRGVMPQTDQAPGWKREIKTGRLNVRPPFAFGESLDESVKRDFYKAIRRGSPFRVMHADGMDSLVWKVGSRQWKIQRGDEGIIYVSGPRDAWGAVTGYGHNPNPVRVIQRRIAWPIAFAEAAEMVMRRGNGKTTKPAMPKGTVVKVATPETPEDGDEDLIARLKAKLKAAQERFKKGDKASRGKA
jgi:hypothetical protein